MPVGCCVWVYSVVRPSACVAMAARGSSGKAASRWLWSETFTTCAARAIAASTAAGSPKRDSAHTFPGASGQICGASGSIARRASVTHGSSSYSTATCSAASCAWRRVAATTATTGCPTYRTASSASG